MQSAAANTMPSSIQVSVHPGSSWAPLPQRPAQAGPSRGLRRPSCPAAAREALTPLPSPSPALFQARLEAYKAAKDTQTAEELKAALDAKMAKATAKHEDILKMKVEA